MNSLFHKPSGVRVINVPPCTSFPRTCKAAPLALASRLTVPHRLTVRAMSSKKRTSNTTVMSGANTPSLLDMDGKAVLVAEILAAKEASGMTFTQIANELGLTNAYVANLFMGQGRLTEETTPQLRALVPALNDKHVALMQCCPMRSFDEAILQDPHVYRTHEAIMHYGEAMKHIINEECGDGIMSAIDFFLTVGTVEGKLGEKRVVITFNGKFLPHIEQKLENITAPFTQNGITEAAGATGTPGPLVTGSYVPSTDPMEEFCGDNPDADECRVYED